MRPLLLFLQTLSFDAIFLRLSTLLWGHLLLFSFTLCICFAFSFFFGFTIGVFFCFTFCLLFRFNSAASCAAFAALRYAT
eukprot:UN17614